MAEINTQFLSTVEVKTYKQVLTDQVRELNYSKKMEFEHGNCMIRAMTMHN